MNRRKLIIAIVAVSMTVPAVGVVTRNSFGPPQTAYSSEVAASPGSIPETSASAVGATTAEPQFTATFLYPRDLSEVLARADVIVVAEVKQIAFVGDVAPYDATAAYSGPRMPVTDYELSPERIIRSDAHLAEGGKLIVRVMGHPGQQEDEASFLLPKVGERSLFFLSVHPDGATYGLFFQAASRIKLDEPVARYSDRERRLIPFASGVSPETFVDIVTEAVR